MELQLVGCSHQTSSVSERERLAFSRAQVETALQQWRCCFPEVEAVLLSTCNRVELYTATEFPGAMPSLQSAVGFLTTFHGLRDGVFLERFSRCHGEHAMVHLFEVACSLDSAIIGDAQILSQVKEAYELACSTGCARPLLHSVFQAAFRVARRVAHETELHQHRVSVPSVAVAEVVANVFEVLTDKVVLVIGAGEMAQESLRYLTQGRSVPQLMVANRNPEAAERVAAQFAGRALPWEELDACLVQADLIISATASAEPIVDFPRFQQILSRGRPRTVCILDLAVPRDFEARIGELPDVLLYCVDDLKRFCEANEGRRRKARPAACQIVAEEAAKLQADLHFRQAGAIVERLRAQANLVKSGELSRLLHKIQSLDAHAQKEIHCSFDRLVNKLLHPPLASLRQEARHGAAGGLAEALSRLFRL
jgi:glutamyl-tRNA reductase